jgi:hypothetical protein
MSEPIQTGDAIHINLATTGQKCQVYSNGHELPGLKGITITTHVGEVTRLSLEAFYPWPRVVGPDGRAAITSFEGYFISREDWEAFDAWRKHPGNTKP